MNAALGRVLDAVRATTGEPKRLANGGWQGRCPAHPDRDPSLGITEGREGRVLITCYAGCATEDVVAALGLTMADLFEGEPQPKRSTKPQVVATYCYARADGTPVFEVLRYQPKDFRQRRADGSWGLAGLSPEDRALPFRLPKIAANPGRIVAICEGERDVLTLEQLGLIATTNAAGAGRWSDQHTRHLVEAGVVEGVVFADADDPGRRHGLNVAQSLQAAGIACPEVWVAACECCKDVTDLAARHGDIPEWPLVDLLATAPDDATHAVPPSATSVTSALSPLPAEMATDGTDAVPMTTDAVPMTTDAVPMPELGGLGLLGRFTKALTQRFEVMPEFALATALGAVAVPCGLGLDVKVQPDWREPALVQLLVAADPGERKSPLLAATVGGLRAAERELREKRDAEIAQAEHAAAVLDEFIILTKRAHDVKARAEAMAARKEVVIPPKFRALTRGGTGEALERLAATQGGKLAIATDEGGALFGDLSRYATVPNLEVLLSGYDGAPYANERITRDSVALDSLRMPLLAMIQPSVLAGLRNDPAAVGRGLLARFSVVAPGSLVGSRRGFAEPLDPELVGEWERLTAELMRQAYEPEPRVAVFSDGARARLEAYAQSVESRMNTTFEAPILRAWAAKLVGRTARLAGVLHAVLTGSLGGTIEPRHVELAIGIAEWLAAHAVAQLGGIGRGLSRDAERLLRWGESRDSFTASEAVKGLYRWTRARFDAAIRELTELGLAEARGSHPARWVVSADG